MENPARLRVIVAYRKARYDWLAYGVGSAVCIPDTIARRMAYAYALYTASKGSVE